MPTQVKLMNEYTIAWPLWAFGGPAAEGDLPVSAALAQRLRTWASSFNEHYDWENGWDQQSRPAEHAEEAVRLHRALQDDLGPGYEVVLHLWEAPAP